MPYKSNEELPEKVKNNLPKGAQTIFLKAYNNAEKQYKDPKKRRNKQTPNEEVSSKVAWSAVKKKYKKEKDKWVKIKE